MAWPWHDAGTKEEEAPMKPWMLLMVLISSAAPAQAETYKWVDADGKIHYSDHPPPPEARQIERKQLGDKPAEVALPYVLKQAMKNFPVTLFAYECGDGCSQARDLLVKRGVPHTSKDPTAPGMREELRKVTGGDEVVPVLQVGRRVLRGFEEDVWNAALDNAGYPKTALVPIKPVQDKPAAGEPQIAPEQEPVPESGS
jgi:hypothetical protein